jgi:hypothetical protein
MRRTAIAQLTQLQKLSPVFIVFKMLVLALASLLQISEIP